MAAHQPVLGWKVRQSPQLLLVKHHEGITTQVLLVVHQLWPAGQTHSNVAQLWLAGFGQSTGLW